MWEGFFMLLTLSTIMAIASFLAGVLPLSFSLSQRQLRFMSLLGTGVLVGTSLIVIIPEGIETMYSAGKSAAHAHALSPSAQQPNIPSGSSPQKPGAVGQKSEYAATERSGTEDTSFLRSGASKGPGMNIIVEKTPETGHRRARRSLDDTKQKQKQKQKQKDTQKEKETDKDVPAPQRGGDDDSTEGHEEGHTRVHAPEDEKEEIVEAGERPEPHAYIGVSLILGFILMFLVDHLPEALSPTKPKYQPLHISLSDLSRGPHNSSSVSLNALNTPVSPMPERQRAPPRKSSATTVGLIIHAFADGIALGASSTAPSTSLSLIIFFAIMLHKAPAAFGLTAVLLKNGLSKRTARTHLMFFSLAAPAGAAFTWAVVHALGRARLGGDDSLTWMTGWVLLFSGGTFLYVAMHSMTEATSSHDHEDQQPVNGYIDARQAPSSSSLSKSDISITMIGMLIPLLTQVGHVH
ncbi:Zinc/iron permease [Lophiostoma macrostomum CBS 122681]|uniref:Zinc/iron permease n=1 Tax=Lophiostoma macrostomum CBS 122681 TaxID=1314788 RepID=A0A6A6TE60_9PLEO|nr:Zinc/iron permease [Lophiostoma macrostomum CBS 122681]